MFRFEIVRGKNPEPSGIESEQRNLKWSIKITT